VLEKRKVPLVGDELEETAMKAEHFVVTPQNCSEPLNVLGVRITVLASNTQTRGYEITLQSGDEGIGPPPHRHDWDESFYVLRGTVDIVIEGQAVACGPGTLVHVPAGTVHGYRYCAGGGEMLEITGKGGRATRMFTDLSKRIPPGPPDLPLVTAALAENGVTLSP